MPNIPFVVRLTPFVVSPYTVRGEPLYTVRGEPLYTVRGEPVEP